MTAALIFILVLLGAAGLYLALPKPQGRHVGVGAVVALLGLACAFGLFHVAGQDGWTQVLFYVFAASSVAAGVAMITSVNPVYSALWFALVVLSTCGLFLLQNAQFLAAATVIVYAGAIVVTFLFVVMLAGQRGQAAYDRAAREPALGVLASFVILAALLTTLAPQRLDPVRPARASGAVAPTAGRDVLIAAEMPDQTGGPAKSTVGHVRELGTRLFSKHLIALEIAGVLLLVAMVGAIAIVGLRARRGTSDEDEAGGEG